MLVELGQFDSSREVMDRLRAQGALSLADYLYMQLNPTYDVAIVGGGLAGLATAIGLRKKGWSVALFEKEKFPFHVNDMVYRRTVVDVKEYSNAVVICIMDTSGSMDQLKRIEGLTPVLVYRVSDLINRGESPAGQQSFESAACS